MTEASAAQHEDLRDNPLATPSTLPFHSPPFDRIRDEHFLPAFKAGMQQQIAEVRAIATSDEPPTFANTIEALGRSGQLLQRTAQVFFNLTGANTNDTLQQIQADVAPKLAQHRDAIWLDAELFARVKAVHADRASLTAEERRLTERLHTAFVRAGAELDSRSQQRIREINAESSKLTTQFQEHLLAETKALGVFVDDDAELAGLSASDRSAAAAAAKEAGHESGFLLTLELPTSQTILSSLENRDLRRRVYEASIARCNRGNEHDTSAIVTRLCALRAERAALLGHPTHAHYVLADETAKTPEAVERMLGSMTAAIVAKAKAEAAELQAWLDAHQPGTRLEPWDWAFVAERVRRERYDLDGQEVRQYFELERVLQDGLFLMARRLYGVTMKERSDLPVYHEDVRCFEMLDEDGSAVGLFFLDCFTRPGKRGGAWMSSFVEQNGLTGDLPVVVNVLNVSKPSEGPALLGFDLVTTMFHEFGHALHGLFSKVHFPTLSGTNVPRDFVEFPSQFHEDWAFDDQVLASCAHHHRTGEAMPKELVERIRRARRFGQGFASLEYIAAAWLDLAWHSLPTGTDVTDVAAFEQEALERAGVAFELVPPRYKSHYFAHIWPGGYSSGYYAYLWSEALAADAFAACMENGGMTRQNGQRLRDEVLSRGFSRDAIAMFEAFRGRPLDTTALLHRRGLVPNPVQKTT